MLQRTARMAHGLLQHRCPSTILRRSGNAICSRQGRQHQQLCSNASRQLASRVNTRPTRLETAVLRDSYKKAQHDYLRYYRHSMSVLNFSDAMLVTGGGVRRLLSTGETLTLAAQVVAEYCTPFPVCFLNSGAAVASYYGQASGNVCSY